MYIKPCAPDFMQVCHIARTLGVHIVTFNYSASCLTAYNTSTRGIERMELAHYSERSYTMTHTAPSNPSDPLPLLSFNLTYLSLTYTSVRIRSPIRNLHLIPPRRCYLLPNSAAVPQTSTFIRFQVPCLDTGLTQGRVIMVEPIEQVNYAKPRE